MKKTKLFVGALALLLAVACDKDDDNNETPQQNQVSENGTSSPIISSSVTYMSVDDYFPGDSSDTKHKARLIALSAGSVGSLDFSTSTLTLLSSDTASMATGVYTFINTSASHPVSETQGNMSTFYYVADPSNPALKNAVSGAVTVNSFSDTQANLTFSFILEDDTEITGRFNGTFDTNHTQD